MFIFGLEVNKQQQMLILVIVNEMITFEVSSYFWGIGSRKVDIETKSAFLFEAKIRTRLLELAFRNMNRFFAKSGPDPRLGSKVLTILSFITW